MKYKVLIVLTVFLLSTLVSATELWSDDMSSVSGWSQQSNISNEAAVQGGIYAVSDTYIQMNSWGADAGTQAKWTNMWKSTGVTVADDTDYQLVFTVKSFASSKNLTLSFTSVSGGVWDSAKKVETIIAPSTDQYTDYYMDFSTKGTENDDWVGSTIGIGCNAGWWNNLGIDNIAIQEVPEPATMALIGIGGILIRRRRI